MDLFDFILLETDDQAVDIFPNLIDCSYYIVLKFLIQLTWLHILSFMNSLNS